MFNVVAVIEGNFLAFGDVLEGVEKEAVVLIHHFAIGRAGMIDQAGWIPRFVPVEVVRLVEVEDVNRGGTRMPGRFQQGQPAAVGFLFIDQFAPVFQQLDAFANGATGKDTSPVNRRKTDFTEGVDALGSGLTVGKATHKPVSCESAFSPQARIATQGLAPGDE